MLSKPEQTQLDLSGTFQWTHGYSQESLWPAGSAQGPVLEENTTEIMHLKNVSPDLHAIRCFISPCLEVQYSLGNDVIREETKYL